MPTYNYQCQDCGNIIEIFQKMSDATLEKSNCNKCKKEKKVKRIIQGGSGMIFKGSGFYLTDYTGYGKPLKDSSSETSTKDSKDKKENKSKD